MRVEMTQEDIDQGVMDDVSQCAVANALNRVTGHEWSVVDGVAYRDEPHSREIPLGYEVRKFIKHYDNGDSVEPIAFEFDWSPT